METDGKEERPTFYSFQQSSNFKGMEKNTEKTRESFALSKLAEQVPGNRDQSEREELTSAIVHEDKISL